MSNLIISGNCSAANEKHDIPYLHDDIWRLYKVAKKGTLTKSLTQAKIKTVGDFIVRLYLNHQSLEEVLVAFQSYYCILHLHTTLTPWFFLHLFAAQLIKCFWL